MFEKLDSCPSCGHSKFENYLIATDHLVSGDSFALVKCSKCQLVFTNPRPTIKRIGSFYDSKKYHSHHSSLTPISLAYTMARFFALRRKINLVNRIAKTTGNLLDFGCGSGDFLSIAQNRGWNIFGLEADDDARSLAETKTKIHLDAQLSELDGTEYNVITLWHVLEHVHDLISTLKSLKKRLSKNGHLFIAVPNLASADSLFYKEQWAGLDVPRHLYHFTHHSFKHLASILNLKLIDIIPMRLDAYYVSILSEKNNANFRLFNAIKQGWKSNRSAKQSGQYSSLIYILRK